MLLHEGLGSVARWADFPHQLASRCGLEVIAYSRAGYGRSDPKPRPWADDFMHREATEALPELLRRLQLDRPPVLVGHSDGGSIALIAAGDADLDLEGVVALAPHLFVEPITLEGIRRVSARWRRDDGFRRAFSFHHRAGSELFEAWSDAWLRPSFKAWDISEAVRRITVPILAVQGYDDAFGTLDQLHTLTELAPQTRRVELPDCGHAPHLERPDAVLDAIAAFLVRISSEQTPRAAAP